MKYAIVIDSVAAVPSSFIERRPFEVMPVSVEIDGELVPDTFDEQTLVDFYTSGQLKVKSSIVSSPPSANQITKLITETVAPKYDYAFCQTISKQISPTFDNFQMAAKGIAKKAREVRNGLGIEHSFHMNCINTGSTISGCGLIAIYADMILNKGKSYNDFLKIINMFTRAVHCYACVTDILYSRARAQEKGIKSMSFPAAFFGKTIGLNPVVKISYDHVTEPVAMKRGIDNSVNAMLDYAAERIPEGLYAPIINISYAGDLNDLERFTSYQNLLDVAQKHKVTILTGVMNLAAGVIFGPGAVTMGIAPKNQSVKPS
ncbi:MAG: DegV family protein [Gammaproteobacteria bacterium]|nr:DegV family protein [Gammaproteobacteria bacterium]